jgi:hypothetical protein
MQDLQRGEKLVLEIGLPPPDTGERRGGADHRPLAGDGAVFRLDAPDRRDDVAVDPIGALDRLERGRMLLQQFAPACDALVGDQEIDIVPERLGELRLRVDEVHDLHFGLEPRRVLLEACARDAAPRRLGPHSVDAVLEVRDRRQDRIRLHQRMAGRARLPAPALALRRDGTGRGDLRERKAVILRECRARCDHQR